MKYEEKAFGKIGLAMTRSQRKKWNEKQLRRIDLIDNIQIAPEGKWKSEQVKELNDLIKDLPVYDLDGKGFMNRSGEL